jgi:hypothetical protein
MLAQVKKLTGDDLAGRLGAWWNGRDYVAPPEGEAKAEPDDPKKAAKAEPPKVEPPKAEAPKPEAARPDAPKVEIPVSIAPNLDPPATAPAPLDGGEIRIRALETLWGEGRLSPGSFALDTHIIDAALELVDRPGAIGFIGADASLLNAFTAQSDRKPIATEWRAACVARLNELVANAAVSVGEVDRPRGFQDGAMPTVVSVEAFAYADHKAGLVGRVFRALDAGGRWVFLDTTRRTNKTPPQAFASAWAEPQLATNAEIEELLTLAGFKTIRRISVSDLVLSAAKQGYASLAQVVEGAGSSGLAGREGALFLQELAWEAQSWRARMRALEGGALEMNLWVADRTEQQGALSIAENQLVQPDDGTAADTLFE